MSDVAREYSVFKRRTLGSLHDEVRKVYTGDDRPWVIGYSGGKDSTTAVQLVWSALKELPIEKRRKPVYVISSDTLVETPVIVSYIDNTLEGINRHAHQAQMPFSATKVSPPSEDSFWVNLIGKGYPAPSKTFRWCTERLKIKPANKFILDKVAEFGEVIVILGVRLGESATRDQVLSLRRMKGSLLSIHSTLPRAYVYTPIVEFTTDDVWNYLLQVPSPWGGNNRDLLALYKNANAGECPLVVDTSTPSCGNSRFGCWVCTVVNKDKSMEALVDSGEEWLLPLLEFRDLLAETQDPQKKRHYREYKRKDGRVYHTKEGEIVPGPYKLEWRKEFMKRLLSIQEQIRLNPEESSLTLISMDEIREIRRIWRTEEQDWEDSVPAIYREATGNDIDWIKDDTAVFTGEDYELLEEICLEEKVPIDLVAKLTDLERQLQGMNRRSNVINKIDKIMCQEWRSEEDVIVESKLRQGMKSDIQ